MKQVVFPQKKVTSFLKSHFVTLMLDVQSDKLPKGFSSIGVPTFFVLDKNGKKLGMILGGMSADKFIERFTMDKKK